MASQRLEKRCEWPRDNALMINYHDHEWGVPCVDDQKLFEYVVLDTFQAGLSWQIILNKRENFRKAFDNFNAKKIANYREEKIKKLLQDTGIIRNRLKIKGTIANAQQFLVTQKEFGSFSKYLWSFVKNKTIVHKHQKTSEIGSTSEESDALARDMKRRGFKFCGSTVCYAFMQGAGLINDHLVSCFRYRICKNLARKK
ncbi:DNA-3-methyladenine glycosylase I [Candidatus Nomurabacteria bacterium]|nr:DNA-3-methyladenine glycosylase I [Candidatus Nomurabacteria bacterium]